MAPLLLWIIASLLVCIGIVGVVIPAVPGALFVFLGLLIAAAADGFQRVGWPTVFVLALCTAATYGIDFLATAAGAKRVGASKSAVVGAMIGALIGVLLGVPGIILGPLVGAIVGELIARKDFVQAGKAGLGTWVGLLLGTVMKLAMVFIMIGIFVAAYIF